MTKEVLYDIKHPHFTVQIYYIADEDEYYIESTCVNEFKGKRIPIMSYKGFQITSISSPELMTSGNILCVEGSYSAVRKTDYGNIQHFKQLLDYLQTPTSLKLRIKSL